MLIFPDGSGEKLSEEFGSPVQEFVLKRESGTSILYIDDGQTFDWGKTSEDYAKYRDIYPEEFYQYILKLGLCKDGQRVLDIGTGTGGFLFYIWDGYRLKITFREKAKILS